MVMKDTRDIARRWIHELWNKGNFAISDELVAPDYLRHDSQLPLRGRESYLAFIREYRRTFPVMEFTIEDHSPRRITSWELSTSIFGILQG
jgi:hypothetical protein